LNDLPTSLPIEAVLAESPAPRPLQFVREVASLYHRNAWLFLKMLLPAAIFGYMALFLCTNRANEIGEHLPRGLAILEHKVELAEMTAYRWGGFVADWIFYCFAFAGMTVAVRKLAANDPVEPEECFQPVRESLVPFLSLAVVLCVLTMVTCLISVFVLTFVRIQFLKVFQWVWVPQNAVLFGFVIMFPGLLVVSRFGLTLPALILENCSVKQSFFRSDELTEGCWTILALLLLESVGGSYLAFVLPQWLAGFAIAHGFVPWWISWAALAVSLLAGVLLQPHMLVGFALLHIRRADGTCVRSRAIQNGY
jgi:hypothetical protein